MLLCKHPTRQKHSQEFALLANLRQAALIAGDKLSQSDRVQARIAALLRHLITALPSPEFQAKYMNQAGELGEGLAMRVDHDMSMVTIQRVNANNVRTLHKVSVSVTVGGQQ